MAAKERAATLRASTRPAPETVTGTLEGTPTTGPVGTKGAAVVGAATPGITEGTTAMVQVVHSAGLTSCQ